LVLAAPLSQLHLELYCFKTGRKIEDGGLGKFQHFKNVCKIILPDLIWNEWLEDQIRSLCDDHYALKLGETTRRHVAWAGCGSAGKTFGAALYAFVFFLADPLNTIVVLTSTSAKMVRKRIWPVLSGFFVKVRDNFGDCGNLVDSKTTIQAAKGNDKNAIFAMAVGEGETNKAAANIQGMHAPRILVVIDEATDVQEAILIAIENLKKSCQDFTELYIGNAKSRLDPLGRAMEPKDGWTSVSVDSDEWTTKHGICIHFDGFKSPNVKAKKTIYPFIYTWEDYQDATQNGDTNSIAFWMYQRGFPPPDGVQNTVFSEPMVDQFDGRGKFTFLTKKRTVAGLDSAFGGDECVLQFAEYGDIEGDKTGVQLTERIIIKGDATSKQSLDYQIAHRAIEECKKRGMRPEELGVDATGIGRGVYATIVTNWNEGVNKCEFGGAASDLPSSYEDSRPGSEVFATRVSELWFMVRNFLEAGQLKGLDVPVIKDFCTRQYEHVLKRVKLEPKADMKKRVGNSPDKGDAVAVLIDTVRRLGVTPHGRMVKRSQDAWDKAMKKFDDVYEAAVTEDHEMFSWMQ
jgi:hypothetical protein